MKAQDQLPGWSPWEPYGGWVQACHTQRKVGRLILHIAQDEDGQYDGWFEGHRTRLYPTLPQVMKALEQALYRYITTEEQRLKELRATVKQGLEGPSVPEDETEVSA